MKPSFKSFSGVITIVVMVLCALCALDSDQSPGARAVAAVFVLWCYLSSVEMRNVERHQALENQLQQLQAQLAAIQQQAEASDVRHDVERIVETICPRT